MRLFFLFLLPLPFSASGNASGKDVEENRAKPVPIETEKGNALSMEKPMAPFIGPGKKDVINELRRHKKTPVTITLGLYDPQFLVRYAEGFYALLPLVLNQEKAMDSARQKQEEGYYQPEMAWPYLEAGAPIIHESNRELFISKLEAWPGWREVEQNAQP